MKMWKLYNNVNNNEDWQRINFISSNLNPNHQRMYFCYFVLIPPWKGVWPFICTNLNESPSPKNAMCQVWLKLAQWFWRRFLNFVNVFLLFQYYFPFARGSSVPSLVETGSVVLKMKIFIICQCIFAIS